MPPAFPPVLHSSGLNLLFPFLHDQVIHRLIQVHRGFLPIPSISQSESLHPCFMTESSLDNTEICLLFFSSARPDTRVVTKSQLRTVSL